MLNNLLKVVVFDYMNRDVCFSSARDRPWARFAPIYDPLVERNAILSAEASLPNDLHSESDNVDINDIHGSYVVTGYKPLRAGSAAAQARRKRFTRGEPASGKSSIVATI